MTTNTMALAQTTHPPSHILTLIIHDQSSYALGGFGSDGQELLTLLNG